MQISIPVCTVTAPPRLFFFRFSHSLSSHSLSSHLLHLPCAASVVQCSFSGVHCLYLARGTSCRRVVYRPFLSRLGLLVFLHFISFCRSFLRLLSSSCLVFSIAIALPIILVFLGSRSAFSVARRNSASRYALPKEQRQPQRIT